MPPEENAPPSMSESLHAAIESVETGTPSTPDDSVASTAAEAPAPAAEPATPTQDRGAPQRGADGKFLKRDVPPEPTPAPAPHAVPPAAGAATAAPQTPAAVAPDDAPPAWTPAAKEKWAALDPALKGEIQRRERDIAVGMQRAADVRKFGDSVMSEFAPYARILADEGATPQAAIRSLLETSYTLRFGSPEHRHALFASLASQYGIDLNRIVQGQIDPEKARLQWELDSRQVHDARAQTAAQDELAQDVQGELTQFVQSPGHEHYETVRQVMAGLMQTGVATTLQEAYDRACWSDPGIRATLQMAENARRVQEQGKNRNALLSVNGAPGAVNGVGPSADPANLRGFLESQFTGTAGRV
jgi:hypothetical protein